jgi:MFS transporter, DHA3 family, multidrug efflux protein
LTTTLTPEETAFRSLLVNTLVSGVTSTFLWFALTFWVYLETRSVVVTGVIGGAFSISMAVLGPLFGTYVDRTRKKFAMQVTTAAGVVCFAGATAVFVAIDAGDLLQLRSPWFWLMTSLTLIGSTAVQLRSIALSTCVTLLVPEERRDKANGLVGTVGGVSFALTSVFSGLVIGSLGMGWAFYSGLFLLAVTLAHLATITIDEAAPTPVAGDEDAPRWVDVRGALTAIHAAPGLMMLILLGAFNNLLTGVFMALMDPYGLELVAVETWGFLFGFMSLAFIGGGLAVARYGLGPKPVRIIILANLVNWIMCSLFTVWASIITLAVGMFIWMSLAPIIEAAEQTVLQRAIPFERQGRVFGFAQLVENSAAPITAFAIAPFAEAIIIPFMTDGGGADLIGGWFGTGTDRGIALIFTVAGLVGVVVTLAVRASKSYRLLVTETSEPTEALAA